MQLAAHQLCQPLAHSHGNGIKSSSTVWHLSHMFKWNCHVDVDMLILSLQYVMHGAVASNTVCNERQRVTVRAAWSLGVSIRYIWGFRSRGNVEGRMQEGWGPAGALSQCIQVELMGSNRKSLNVCAPPKGLEDYSSCAHSLAQSCRSYRYSLS